MTAESIGGVYVCCCGGPTKRNVMDWRDEGEIKEGVGHGYLQEER